MDNSKPLMLRWIWLSVYIIAGCLSLAYIILALLDTVPSGIFYAGFGGACFVGAYLATLHSGGSSVVESSIGALLIGLLNLIFLVFAVGSDEVTALEKLSAPLSTTVVCFAGALSGGQLASRNHVHARVSESKIRMATTAFLVLLGATATHIAFVALAAFGSEGLAMFLGVLLFFTTPAIAGYAFQLSTKANVTPPFAVGIAAAAISILLLMMLDPYASVNFQRIIVVSAFLFFGSLVALVLISAGAAIARGSTNGQGPQVVPEAVVVAHRDGTL